MRIDRKTFLQNLSMAAGAALLPDFTQAGPLLWKKPKMQLGFVTYLWGKDWDVPTLIKNLSDTHITGVELRVEHAHKVMPDLTPEQRKAVKKQFADSPVKIVGLGTN